MATAPKGYGARLALTARRTNVLTIRTVGSSSCPFELDTIEVVDKVIEVADLNDADASQNCTDDLKRSATDYLVPDQEFELFRNAKFVVVTDRTGQRFRMGISSAIID